MGNLTTLAAAIFGATSAPPAKDDDDGSREKIAANIRDAGIPDALNRWAQSAPANPTKEQGTEPMLSTEPTGTTKPATKKAGTPTKTAGKPTAIKPPNAVKPSDKVAKVPAGAKALKAPPKAPAKPAGKEAAKKPAKAAKGAKAPTVAADFRNRPDGLRRGSKLALLLDAAAAAGKAGATEAELCKKLGWKACAVTLRRVCDRVGAKCERKDGKFVVTLAKKAS